MSTQSRKPPRRRTTRVDLKKVDYTIRDFEDTNSLKQELVANKDDPQKLIDIIEEQGDGIRPVMHILGRTPGGSEVHLRVHGVKPYFYVPFSEFDEDLKQDDKVTDWEKGHENIRGEHMVKVYTRIPGDVPKLREEYDHHEADILFPNRFLIDEGIEGSIRVPSEYATPEPTDITIEEIQDSEYSEDTRICFCDIEVDDSEGFPDQEIADKEVISITVYDNYREDYQIFLYHPDLPSVSHEKAKVRLYSDEISMLKKFIRYINIRGFDCITGWNFTDFDSRYIVNRLDYLSSREDVEDLSKSDISVLDSAYDDGYFGAKIKGMAVFDMLRAYKNLQFTELDSFSLEDVAQEELGVGKVKDEKSIHELWEEDPQTLVDYNVRDVELTVMLEEQQDIIKFYEEIANYVGGRLGEMIDASKAVDIKILRAVNGEYAVPSSKNIDGEEFEGAEVFDPIIGIKENVIVLDLKSLYPMSMKTLNAGPETKDPDGDIVAPNGVRFSSEKEAVVVEIIDEMLEEREEYKRLRNQYSPESKQYKIYDRKQTAIKIVMNTLYGVMGWNQFRLYDKDVGAAVTAVGREVIKFTEGVVNDMGYEVIYGDTDSVMIELGANVDKKEAINIGEQLEEKINEAYESWAYDEFNVDEHFFDIEFEKLYRRYFQAGKKKRYAGHITWKNGKETDSIDIVGFEYQRSDYSKVAKKLMEEVFNEILKGGGLQDIHSLVTGVTEGLRNGEFSPDVFGVPASVTKSYEAYDSPTVAARAMKYVNEHLDGEVRPGDKPKLAYVDTIDPESPMSGELQDVPRTNKGAGFVCWMNFSTVEGHFIWDWDKYIDIQIKGPLKRILAGTDWTWGEVITGDRQPKLGEYEFEQEEVDSENGIVEFKEPEPIGGPPGDFQDDDLEPWEREELRAKRALSHTQEMLEGWESEEPDEDEVVEASMNQDFDEQPSLDLYL